MGSLSPVIEAFLNGKQLQTDALNKVQDWALKKQQLDEMAKQFQTTSKQAQSRLQLERDIHDLAAKKSELDMHHQILNDIQEGRVLPDQTTQTPAMNLPQQPSAIPGMGGGFNLSTPASTTVPTAGTPITVGDFSGNMPFTSPEIAAQQQNLLIPGQIAGELAKSNILTKQYKDTVGDTKTQQMSNAVDLLNNKLDSQKALADAKNDMMNKYYEDLLRTKDESTAMRETVARIQGENQSRREMDMMFGGETPASAQANAIQYANLAKIGELTPDMESRMSKAEKNFFKQIQTSTGTVTFPVKEKQAAMANLSSGATLLNDYNNLDQKYPAQGSLVGKLGNIIGAKLPLTDIGQEFDRLNASIANLAKQTGESPSMARSTALAKKAEAAKISPGDNPEIRTEKKVKIGDLALDVVANGFNTLPKQQKIENWQQLMQTNPMMQTLKKNIAFKSVFENILKTGEYDPSLINK